MEARGTSAITAACEGQRSGRTSRAVRWRNATEARVHPSSEVGPCRAQEP